MHPDGDGDDERGRERIVENGVSMLRVPTKVRQAQCGAVGRVPKSNELFLFREERKVLLSAERKGIG